MALSAAARLKAVPAHLAFGIVIVDEAFAAATKLPLGLSLLSWPDGSLCVPVVAYAMLRRSEDRADVGTIKLEIYVLREWVARCAALRQSVWEPEDDALDAWRTEMTLARSPMLSATRVEAKVAIVFKFYSTLNRALPWDAAGRRRAAFVAPIDTISPGTKQLTSRMAGGVAVWHRAKGERVERTQRPTPDPWQVRTILDRLRSAKDDGPGRPGAAEDLPTLIAERNYAIGSILAEGGLRADEAARFSLPTLWETLLAHGELQLPDRSADWRALDAISVDPAARTALLDGLDEMRQAFHSSLFFRVRGKGSKERLLELPVGLVRELVDLAVFRVRRRQLEIWTRVGGAEPAAPEMFLSFKTRKRLSSGTIGDIVAKAFDQQPAIPGSAHRLRAYFATQAAIRIWRRCLELNGGAGGVHAQETALELLRDALGHARVTTTLRHYLSLAQFYIGRRDCGIPDADALVDAVSNLRGSLSASRATLATRLVTALGSASDEHLLCQALDMVLKEVAPDTSHSVELGE